jgi:hypothetical protein
MLTVLKVFYSMVGHSDRGPHRRRMLSVLKVFYSMIGHSGIPGVPPTVGPGSSTQCGPDWIPPLAAGYLTDWQHWAARKISSYADGKQMNYTRKLSR